MIYRKCWIPQLAAADAATGARQFASERGATERKTRIGRKG